MNRARTPVALDRALSDRLVGRVVVVGIGNPFRGDDGAGCAVARGLRGMPDLTIVESEDVPERDILRIADARPDTVVLVDAVDLGARPGSVALLEPERLAGYAPSTHRVPLSLLAEILHRACGADVVVLAIQPEHTAHGARLSRAVAESVAVMVDVIRRSAVGGAGGREVAAC